MTTATDRLDVRLLPEDKRLLARAAEIEGVKVTQFLLGVALKRARHVVNEAEQVATTAAGYQGILDALANPPKPTPALVEAMEKYRRANVQWR